MTLKVRDIDEPLAVNSLIVKTSRLTAMMRRQAVAALSFALLSAAWTPPVFAEFKPTPFKPEVRYAQVGDIKLAYYMRGEGEPLVMINGFLATMSLWDPALVEALAKHNKLILFDNRGVGLSTDTKENQTTMAQMADDTAGLIKALGFKKANVLAYSMGARIGQQLIIRHPELINKAVLAGPNPGGKFQDPAARDVEAELNSPTVPDSEKIALTFPDNAEGRKAQQEVLSRIKAAVKAGTAPDDFKTSKQTVERLDRARTTLWRDNNSNFVDLKNVQLPVLITDGRSDVVDPPKNSLIIANQIPFAWLAFFEGGHSFLFQSYKKFADTVNTFLK